MNSSEISILSFSDEILLIIFCNLTNHEDRVNLSHTCTRFERLTQDKSLCETLVFPWNIHVQRHSLAKFLKDRIRQDLIMNLNINDLYWIPSGVIKDIIVKLPKLKKLYAAGTLLSWEHLYRFFKTREKEHYLTHLGWTWDNYLEKEKSGVSISKLRQIFMDQVKEVEDHMTRLQCLVLHVTEVATSDRLQVSAVAYSTLPFFVMLCKGLCELWILSWPSIVSNNRPFPYTAEYFSSDFGFDKMHTFVLNVQYPKNVSFPKLIGKIISAFPGSESSDTAERQPLQKLYFGHAMAESQYKSGLDLSSVELFSLPLKPQLITTAHKGFNLVNCKSITITHGSPNGETLNLNRTFDTAVNLEKFCSRAINYTLDWGNFMLLHPKLEEVNVTHVRALPYQQVCMALSQLEKLKKVSLPYNCLLEINDPQVLARVTSERTLKNNPAKETLPNKSPITKTSSSGKKRVSHHAARSEDRVCGLDLLTSFCTEINELEIGLSPESMCCIPTSRHSELVLDSLVLIKNFTKLTKLSLDKIPIWNGQFLIEIAKSCKLESLRLSDLGTRGKCNYWPSLCSALGNMTELKEFRLEQNYLGATEPLFSALSSCKKLERIVIISMSNSQPIHAPSLYNLVNSCPRLSAIFVIMDGTTAVLCQELRKQLITSFGSSRPPLSVIIQNKLGETLNFPLVHQRDLVVKASQVCGQFKFPY